MEITSILNESCRHQQNRELEVLRSVFGDNVEDLRDRNDTWKPLDIRIVLVSKKDDDCPDDNTRIVVKLRITCPVNYPKETPNLSLEETKGISPNLIDELLKLLQDQSMKLLGEAVIFALTQTVQAFILEQMPVQNIYSYKKWVDTILEFPKEKRRIQFGGLMSSSLNGYWSHAGFDMDNGQLVYITEWKIAYSELVRPCTDSCFWKGQKEQKECGGHKIDEICTAIERHVARLSRLRHKNIIPYECVLCNKQNPELEIYLVQDFVRGTSFEINRYSPIRCCIDGAKKVAREVLDALIYLDDEGVSYRSLSDTKVFLDNTGTIKCTDFGSLVPYLLHLCGEEIRSSGDLPALGAFVQSLMPIPTPEMRDFIDKCNSDQTLFLSELLLHPFIKSTFHDNEMINYGRESSCTKTKNKHDTQISKAPINTSDSRLKTEFMELKHLGKGTFGTVFQARNILDNREYAIKRILLPPGSRKLYKKMTREVELLSRLKHKNVVWYFNSWTENATDADVEELKEYGYSSSDWLVSHRRTKPITAASSIVRTESSSNVLKDCVSSNDNSDSIEFAYSNGNVATYEYEDESDKEIVEEVSSLQNKAQVMYIQMEFCEKCTLRTAIDNDLYKDTNRVRRLFSEIVRGLHHIHQQGIIHRDLKPTNIFLDSHDHIKIGDFGLATTIFLALQSQERAAHCSFATEEGTSSGVVGTRLYIAPELLQTSTPIYDEKVDMYSLGIILFEMSQPPFKTEMKRLTTIESLRTPSITIPENMLKNPNDENAVRTIRWLLNHDPLQRPLAKELLATYLILKEEYIVIREILNRKKIPSTKSGYRCLDQGNYDAPQQMYLSPVFDFVKSKIVNIFRKHGAIELNFPLLPANGRKSLTEDTNILFIQHSDLRNSLVFEIVMMNLNMIRRYSVDRVYRYNISNNHPRQSYECAFDIITTTPGNYLVDAEILCVANEIISEIPHLREKNVFIQMNHGNLLSSILMHYDVPIEMYKYLLDNILDHIEGRLSMCDFRSAVTAVMHKRTTACELIDTLLTDIIVDDSKNIADESVLKLLIQGKETVSSLAEQAIQNLNTVISLAKELGVTCPIHVCPGLPIGLDCTKFTSIAWQMVGDLKLNETSRPTVLAVGERYDELINTLQRYSRCTSISTEDISGVGLSFSLEKLVIAVDSECDRKYRTIDVGVCIIGEQPRLNDITRITRDLWSAGIRVGIVESATADEAEGLVKKLGAVQVILFAEYGSLRVRSWTCEHVQEKSVTHSELIGCLKSLLKCNEM